MPAKRAGRGGSMPIASCTVAPNLAASAVSSTTIGMPGLGMLARHLEGVGGVRIDHLAERLMHLADRRQPVGAGAATAHQAEGRQPRPLRRRQA